MSIPNRAKMFKWKLVWPIFIPIALWFAIIWIASPSGPPPLALVIPSVIGMIIGVIVCFYYPQKALYRRVQSLLEKHGFSKLESIEVEPELAELYRSKGSTTLGRTEIGDLFAGDWNGRRVVLGQHLASSDSQLAFFTSCAVELFTESPSLRIKPKSKFDSKSEYKPLNEDRFDRERAFTCEDIELGRSILLPLVDWFITKRNRFAAVIDSWADDETWIISGNWLIFAQRGQTRADMWIQLAKFATTFADELDCILDTNSSKQPDSSN